MNDLDALVRGGAIGITLLLTAVFLRAWPNRSRAWRHAMRPRYRDSASYGTEAQATCGGLGDRGVKAGYSRAAHAMMIEFREALMSIRECSGVCSSRLSAARRRGRW